jgi:SulP family sulfate permease
VLRAINGDVAGAFAATLIAIPQAMSLGILAYAALGPAYASAGMVAGLITSVVGNVVAAATSDVRAQIIGARASATAVVAGLVVLLIHHPALLRAGVPDAATIFTLVSLTTLLAALMQVGFGLAGLGRAIKFVPYPVVAGFMNGIALVILVSQLRPVLGLSGFAPVADTFAQIGAVRPASVVVALVTLATVFISARIRGRIPPLLWGLAAGIAAHHLLALAWPQHVGPVVGALPSIVPLPETYAAIARLDWAGEAWTWAAFVLPSAFFLAAVCALDGLLAAVITDSMTRGRHDSNRELMSQGLANALIAGFGGLPAVGNTSTPAASYLAGGRTRRAALFHALFVLAAMFALGPLLEQMPVAALGGLMIYIALLLIDRWSRDLLRRVHTEYGRHREVFVNLAVVTIVAVSLLLANVMVALAMGVGATVLLLLVKLSGSPVRRNVDATVRTSVKVRAPEARELLLAHGTKIRVLELEGELFFGTADRLQAEIEALPSGVRFVIIDLRRVHQVDASGARVLEMTGRRAAHSDTRILLSHVRLDEPHGRYFKALGIGAGVPPEHWFTDLDRALEWAEDRLLEAVGYREPEEELPPERMELFAGLAPREMALVCGSLERREFGRGDPVFREGEEGDCLHLIARGSVSIKMQLAGETRARRLATLNPGVLFGEMALLEKGQRRSADAFAKGERVVLYSLSSRRFEALVRDEPQLGLKIYQNLSRHLASRLRSTSGALRALE